MKYFQPKSLTWWAGILSISVGVATIVFPESYQLGEIGTLLSALSGGADNSPASLIALGLGLIGIRQKLESGFNNNPDK